MKQQRIIRWVLIALLVSGGGCHWLLPFRAAREDRGQDPVKDQGPLIDRELDREMPFPEGALPPPDGGLLTAICPAVADGKTIGLFTFAGISGQALAFRNEVDPQLMGTIVGARVQRVEGPPNCGGGGLHFPSDPDIAPTLCQNDSGNSFPCLKEGWAQLPSSLQKAQAIDFWVKFEEPKELESEQFEGILSRDASGLAEEGHLSVFRFPDGMLAVRLQGKGQDSLCVCSAAVIAMGKWIHVGINLGAPGLELLINGSRDVWLGEKFKNQCVSGVDQTWGIEGNDEPWLIGALAWSSNLGQVTPVIDPLHGTIANLRFSGARRDFAALELPPLP